MKAQLLILGSNSALPAQGRHPSAQLLSFENEHCLIDCGEGTQLQLDMYKIKRSKITRIFISHLHGDHIFGLPGLLTSYNHINRSSLLRIYGPTGIKNFIESSILSTGNRMSFKIEINEFDPDNEQTLIDEAGFKVDSVRLEHRIPTAGYLFYMRRPGLKIRPSVFDIYSVPVQQRTAIQQGGDFITPDGKTISNTLFTLPKSAPLTYAYLTDTAYLPHLHEKVKGFHTLYHEATFLSELLAKAIETKHSTPSQAAKVAFDAEATRLIIGHFSSRYEELTPFLIEAKEVFESTELAIEGRIFEISN